MSDSRIRRRAAPRSRGAWFSGVRWMRQLRLQWYWRKESSPNRKKSATPAFAAEALTAGRTPVTSAVSVSIVEEHVGLAAMAMPTLPRTGARVFYGRVLVVVAVVAVSFFVTILGLSHVQNLRNQQSAFENFRYDLANATAPVSAVNLDSKLLTPGTPVALLKIPRIGVSAVVVEGTTSDITMLGPGHRRDTVLPGQEGVSVIYGRQFTYGAVFSQLGDLKAGDKIDVTTGQGKSSFKVTGVRYSSEKMPEPPSPGEGRLVLVSASGNVPLMPSGVVRVDATMVGDANLAPLSDFTYAALGGDEEAMMGKADAWPYLALSLAVVGFFVVIFTLLRRFWGKWQTWIVAVPTFVATGSFAATQIAILFPNVI